MKKKNIFVEWYNWALFCLITFFIGGITPFAMGAEPYIIYWLKKRGLSLKEATSLVASFTVINPFIQVVITWPSFFVLCADYHTYADNIQWVGCFWSVFVGLIIDLIGTLFWLLMSYSKNAHYWLNILINWVKKFFKLKYKTKEEIRYEYKENATFKKMFINELKDIKFLIFVSLGSLIWNVLYYSEIICAFNFMDPEFRFNAGDLFNYVNVATTANNFIPIPGAEGSLQAVLIVFIQNSSNNIITEHNELADITNNSVFIWRTFTFYITTILGLCAILVLIGKEFYKYTIRKIRYKNGFNTNTYTIIIKSHNQNIENTLNSLMTINYDANLFNVIIAFKTKQKPKIDKKYKMLDITLIECKNLSSISILRKISNKKLLLNDYVQIVESGDQLTYDSWLSLNHVFRNYDIYANQYKNYTNGKLNNKKTPFKYVYFKRFNKYNKMITPLENIGSFVFSKKFINCIINDKTIKTNNELVFYLRSLKHANNLRYRKKLLLYKLKNNLNEPYSDKYIQSIINENINIGCYLLLNKCVRKSLRPQTKFKIDNQKIKFTWLPWYLRILRMLQFKLFIKNNYLIINN